MKELWKTFRLAAYVFALPLIATAAVSAYQWTSPQDHPIAATPVKAVISTVVDSNRSHSIMLDQNGMLNGRIWSTDSEYKQHFNSANMNVMLFQSGKMVTQGTTNESGQFALPNVKPGIYSFVARGKEQISVYAIQVSKFDPNETPANFESITVSNRSTEVAKAIQASAKRSNVSTVSQQMNIDVHSGNRIQLDRNNNLYGSLVPTIKTNDLSGNPVYLMRNGQKIATATPSVDGRFVFNNVQPGKYDFVSAGQNGVVAMGLEAIGPQSLVRQTSFNPAQEEFPESFDIPLIDPNDVIVIFPDDTVLGNFVEGGFVDGGFIPNGGGFGPGVGGGGGFGGFGAGLFSQGGQLPGILGLTGFGLGLAALLDDDNPPAPTSPTN